jgi:hypothetical protein
LPERVEGVEVGALAVEVDGQDGLDVVPNPEAEEFGDSVRGEVEGPGVDIREERPGAGAQDATGTGEEAERSGNDRIRLAGVPGGGGAVAYSSGGEGEPEGVCAAGASDAVARAQAAAAAASKAATRGPRMKLCESQTWAIASSISCPQRAVLARKIKHWNGFEDRLGHASNGTTRGRLRPFATECASI